MTETFDKALEQASNEYKSLYKKMRFVKNPTERVPATNMGMMRARDIERENSKPENGHEFCFTISTYDPDQQRWLQCPGCGDTEINKLSANGNEWQGCYRCHVLLDKYGKIKSMKSQSQKPKEPKQEADDR